MLYIQDMLKKNRAVQNMMLLGMKRRKPMVNQDGNEAKKIFGKKKMKISLQWKEKKSRIEQDLKKDYTKQRKD